MAYNNDPYLSADIQNAQDEVTTYHHNQEWRFRHTGPAEECSEEYHQHMLEVGKQWRAMTLATNLECERMMNLEHQARVARLV